MRKHMHTEWPVEPFQSHKRLYAYSMHTLASSIGRGPPKLAYALCTSLVLIMDKNEKLISWKKGQQNHFPVLASTLVLASTRVWILIEVMPKPKPNKMSGKNESTEKATFDSSYSGASIFTGPYRTYLPEESTSRATLRVSATVNRL